MDLVDHTGPPHNAPVQSTTHMDSLSLVNRRTQHAGVKLDDPTKAQDGPAERPSQTEIGNSG